MFAVLSACFAVLLLANIALGLADGSMTGAGVDEAICDFWLAPSTMKGVGRGTVSGRDYKANEVLDVMVAVSLPYDWIQAGSWSLGNYVFARYVYMEYGLCSEDYYFILLLSYSTSSGASMITLALHNIIILIITHISTPKSTQR